MYHELLFIINDQGTEACEYYKDLDSNNQDCKYKFVLLPINLISEIICTTVKVKVLMSQVFWQFP